MTRFPKIVTLGVALLSVASLASAQTTSSAKKPATNITAKPAGTTAKTAKTTSVVATGKISKFDAASKALTVTTSKGDVTFTLADKAVLKDGSKTIQADALSGLTGQSARVSYTEKEGAKTATSVHVTAPTSKAAHK